MRKYLTNRGFTLIELLVVIAIIGILASFILASMSESRGQARDAERLNDLKQIQTALELYYNRNKAYPTTGNLGDISTYIASVPSDPITSRAGGSEDYQYQSDGQDYAIQATSDDETIKCEFRNGGTSLLFVDSDLDCPFY